MNQVVPVRKRCGNGKLEAQPIGGSKEDFFTGNQGVEKKVLYVNLHAWLPKRLRWKFPFMTS
jgi:hypothetical protein